jgi:hypothetical protein
MADYANKAMLIKPNLTVWPFLVPSTKCVQSLELGIGRFVTAALRHTHFMALALGV